MAAPVPKHRGVNTSLFKLRKHVAVLKMLVFRGKLTSVLANNNMPIIVKRQRWRASSRMTLWKQEKVLSGHLLMQSYSRILLLLHKGSLNAF